MQIRGHWVLDSYFGQEKPATTWDGWFDTGDIATLDPDGYMVIRDRSKDIIKSGGENVSSVEVERVLLGHDAVAEVAVVGTPHEHWGEAVTAFVVTAPSGEADGDALLDYARGVYRALSAGVRSVLAVVAVCAAAGPVAIVAVLALTTTNLLGVTRTALLTRIVVVVALAVIVAVPPSCSTAMASTASVRSLTVIV